MTLISAYRPTDLFIRGKSPWGKYPAGTVRIHNHWRIQTFGYASTSMQTFGYGAI